MKTTRSLELALRPKTSSVSPVGSWPSATRAKSSFLSFAMPQGTCSCSRASTLWASTRLRASRISISATGLAPSGTVMRTRRGELSVAPAEVVLLSKSLRPLPEKYHGLSDTETRYRQRYVDLIVNPDVRDVFMTRFKIVAAIRRYMDSRGYLEVETPMLHPIPGGATARPFVTHHNALDMSLYLRIAPELYLKRLLVGGFERVFEINRSFRNEGISVRHNPEFTMLEAYEAFGNMESMMDLTEGIVASVAKEVLGTLDIEYQGTNVSLASPWRRATMIELTSDAVGEDVSFGRTSRSCGRSATRTKFPMRRTHGKGKLITELFEKLVEHTLIEPTFVTMYPAETSPLARRNDDDPNLVDRFELIITGREFANAFSELVDPVDQRARFEARLPRKKQAMTRRCGSMETTCGRRSTECRPLAAWDLGGPVGDAADGFAFHPRRPSLPAACGLEG